MNRSIWKHLGLTLLATTLFVAPAWAQVESATVAVDGMACPFCAYGVEKRLKKVRGVKSVRVNLRDNEATLLAKDGESIVVGEIPQAIKKAGFTSGAIEISAVGRLAGDARDGWRLKVGGHEESFSLTDLRRGFEEELQVLATKGAPVRVKGTVRHLDATPPVLAPEAIEAASSHLRSSP